MLERELERITLVAESCGFPAGEIPSYVIDGNNGLHQNILAEDAIFGVPTRVVWQPAVMPLETERNVLAEVQLATIELRVGANGTPLEVVILRCPALMEVIEGDSVSVLVATAVDIQVVVPNRRGTEDGLPPVGAVTARHDQTVRVGVRASIDRERPSPLIFGDRRGSGCIDVLRDRRIIGVAVDVGRDRQAGVDKAQFLDLEIVQGVGDEDIIIAAGRSGDTGSYSQRGLRRPLNSLLGGLDQNHAVTGSRPVNRSRGRILQHLHGGDVVRIQKVEV